MKLWALVKDTFREMYARKVILALIVIEVFALVITGLVLNSMSHTFQGLQEDPLAVAQSAPARTPRMMADDSVLGTLPQETIPADSTARDTIVKKEARHTSPTSASVTFSTGRGVPPNASSLAEGMVIGPMGAYSQAISAAILFIGIFAMASIIPSMMEKGTIDLLVSKPLPRPVMLFGRSLGGFLALAINNLFFTGGVWILYGVFTGVWYVPFLLWTFTIPLFSLLVVFSGVMLLNIFSEGSVLPLIIAYLHITILSTLLTNRESTLFTFIQNDVLRGLLDGLYYVLPQTNDLAANVWQAVFTSHIDSIAPFVQGLVFMTVMFGVSAWKFSRKDF